MQPISPIESKANELLKEIYQKKSDQIAYQYRNKHNLEALELGFSSVGFPEDSVENESIQEILQPGFIFEVIVNEKNEKKKRLSVILQKFLAFSDKCTSAQHLSRQADFLIFKQKRHLLNQLTKLNIMCIKGEILESEVIEDFSIFTYYINFEKIEVGDHLNAVLIDKKSMSLSLKNKCILGGKQWSLKNLQNPSHFDNWLFFRLGYSKQIGYNFQLQAINEDEQKKMKNSLKDNIRYKEESGILKMDYQIKHDVLFQNKQNYSYMLQSLGLNQHSSFTNRNNVKTFLKLNLDHRRHFPIYLYNPMSKWYKSVNKRANPVIEIIILIMQIEIDPIDEKFQNDDEKGVIIPHSSNCPIIEVRNVHKTYLLGLEGVTALRGVTFDVMEQEFIVILGTSGCGKTTLLNLLGSIDLPTKGDVKINRQRIKASTEDKILASLRLSDLGFVFQQFNLISSLTAQENVELPMTLKGTLSRAQITERAKQLLDQVGLGQRGNHFPNQLSGGEQQRVTIARALSNDPRILLLDEPTGDLDTKNSDLIMSIIIDLNLNQRKTIIMVTHDTNLKNFSTRTIRMLDGKVAKIEQNDEKNRIMHIQQLQKTVKDVDRGIQPGVFTEQNLIQQQSKTEMRKPKDYKVLNHLYNGSQITRENSQHQLFIQNQESTNTDNGIH